MRTVRSKLRSVPVISVMLFAICLPVPAQDEETETVTSEDCQGCHDETPFGSTYLENLQHSIHGDFECLDCHLDKDRVPHDESSEFTTGCEGCRSCHTDVSEEYQAHGRANIGECEDMPQCKDCHGDHNILPSSVKQAPTHPTNLPTTCGKCHEDLNITRKYEILIDHPIELYENSVHGKATRGGIYVAATCNDCHSTDGTAHKILSPGHPGSAINHFNIPKTCGKCHKGVENDFWDGIHGKLVARGETDAPVCTHCHGEHGIISPDDPRSPVSRVRVAEATCSPCHESTALNEKYGLATGRLHTFIDSYHGLKSNAGDLHVANCASCHGVHRILPSSDPTSTVYPDNLQSTCGDCHPGISKEMASRKIHDVSGEGLRSPIANLVEDIYIVIIIFTIGLMALHWALDLGRQILQVIRAKPKVQRMRAHEVWQHTFLMLSFIVLVISGFALRFSEGWITQWFFGWDYGFRFRGQLHRYAAILFILTTIWHAAYLITTKRGREFFRDMIWNLTDLKQLWQKTKYNLGYTSEHPAFDRFSYVEKIEYWALLWGTAIMILTGLLLWFDNWFVQFLPKGVLDVALVVHYWEAWLATLAIFIWHFYSTIFSPSVYPMNPSWLTGHMPEKMYSHEHPGHLRKAIREEKRMLQKELDELAHLRAQNGSNGE